MSVLVYGGFAVVVGSFCNHQTKKGDKTRRRHTRRTTKVNLKQNILFISTVRTRYEAKAESAILMHGFLLLQLLFLYANSDTAPLSTYTLVETQIKCASEEDCRRHFNNSWCHGTGFACLHHQCKRIPDYPCRSAQRCREETHQCEDVQCTRDTECDNQIYCDGAEICHEERCVMDPSRPSCLYLGGVCDEQGRTCHLPDVQRQWQKERRSERQQQNKILSRLSQHHDQGGGDGGGDRSLVERAIFKSKSNGTPSNQTDLDDTTVNITAVSIIGVFIALLFIVILVMVVSKSARLSKQY
jgi:hypothetical protein